VVIVAAYFAVSSEGTLAYIYAADVTAARRTLVWIDRQGRKKRLLAPMRLARIGRRRVVRLQPVSDD
jgi:hypothetical protein